MAISRVRLRLTAWSALAFLAGLAVLDGSLVWYLGRQGDRRLTDHMRRAAVGLAGAVEREWKEVDTYRQLSSAVRDALDEWPPSSLSFVVLDSVGAPIGRRGDGTVIQALLRAEPAAVLARPRDVAVGREHPIRVLAARADSAARFTVLAGTSTGELSEDRAALLWWMLLSAPAALGIALLGGYWLSRVALRPIEGLGQAVAAIAPQDLAGELPVRQPPDEIDRLAAQFNDLLTRVRTLQRQSRRFLREAAHQIRTPLTLVLGESDLSLERPRAPAEHREALRRIRTAAQQMNRRVNDLFLLAEAEAGEGLPHLEPVELDALALEAADLLRGRAQGLGRRLELGDVDAAEVLGDAPLLREAMIELLENGCRHGTAETPVRLSVRTVDDAVLVEVENAGPPLPALPEVQADGSTGLEGRGMGLSIVQWIAEAHGGRLEASRVDGHNRITIRLPRGSDGGRQG